MQRLSYYYTMPGRTSRPYRGSIEALPPPPHAKSYFQAVQRLSYYHSMPGRTSRPYRGSAEALPPPPHAKSYFQAVQRLFHHYSMPGRTSRLYRSSAEALPLPPHAKSYFQAVQRLSYYHSMPGRTFRPCRSSPTTTATYQVVLPGRIEALLLLLRHAKSYFQAVQRLSYYCHMPSRTSRPCRGSPTTVIHTRSYF
jgi:hypothetical protein